MVILYTPDDFRIAAINAAIFNELKYAIRALQDAGVKVIVLKGAALANTVYEHVGQRPMSDADLLIHAEDKVKARRVLDKVGFRFVPETPDRFGPFDTHFTGEDRFARPNRPPIDLHWEILPVEWLRRVTRVDQEVLWQDAQPLDWDGFSVLQLSPQDTLIHICLHLVQHSFDHAIAYPDMAYLIVRENPFPWKLFLDRAIDFRIRPLCYFALLTLQKEYSGIVPSEVIESLKPSLWQEKIVSWVSDPRLVYEKKIAISSSRSYLLHVSIAERVEDILHFLAWLFFPGPRWLKERYRLGSMPAAWLSCLWHPLVVLFNGFRGIRTVLAN